MDLSHIKYLFRKAIRTYRREGAVELVQSTTRFFRNSRSAGFDLTGVDPNWLLYFDIDRGDTIIDAGGCLGIFSDLASRMAGAEGEVYTIEPVPHNLEEIRLRLGNRPNVEIIEAAVLDYNGKGEISVTPEKPGANSLVDDLDERASEIYETEVDVLTLDEIYNRKGLDEIDLLQMDVEGAEIKSLEGATETLANTYKVVVEANHPAGDEHDEKTSAVVQRILEENGFNAWIGENDTVYGLNVEKYRARFA